MTKTTLGELETLVLLAAARRSGDAYAVTIREEILNTAGRDVSRGAVYVTLHRLAKTDLLESWIGDSSPQRGGKAKRYYRLTAAGISVLGTSLDALRRMADGVDLVQAP